MEPLAPARKRNAAATRDAILASGRKAFAAAGYDGAGVREIAAGAGITAMMVNHYFGSKEQLFAEVLADTMEDPRIIKPGVLGSPDQAKAMAAALVEQTRSESVPLDGFLILLRSSSNPRATAIGREQIERYHQRQMASAIGGDAAARRAAIALSLIAGFQLMRQMVGLSALVDADPADLTDTLASVFDLIIGTSAPHTPPITV